NDVFAQGAVPASPTAVRISKTPGSRFPARQIGLALSAQAGVTKSDVSRTLSESFGVEEVFKTATFALNVTPTVTGDGHVGVSLPPTPASAHGTATPSKRIPTTPSTAHILPAAAPLQSR